MNKAEYVFIKLAEETNKKGLTDGEKLFLGGIAGAISTAAVHPIGQVTNLHSSFPTDPRFKTYWDTAKNIYKNNIDVGKGAGAAYEATKGLKGVKNFYKGLGGKLVQTAPQSALLLGLNAILYKKYKDIKNND